MFFFGGEYMKSQKWIYILIAVSFMVALTGCGPQAPQTTPVEEAQPTAPQAEEPASAEKELSVCFVNNTTVNDQGWSYAHDQGRQYLEANLEGVKTSYVDEVYDTGGVDAAKVFQDLATQGCDLIYGTSFGYNDAIFEVGAKNPKVIFMNYDQYKTSENVGSFRLAADEGLYLNGILAGMTTKANFIGVVGTFPLPQLLREVNGFARGVFSVNPDATIRVVWLNSWYDPPRAKEAAEGLISAGADVVQQFTTSAAAVQAAEEAGVYGLGYQVDQSEFAPNYLLTSMVYNWGPVYVDITKSVQEGNWVSSELWYGLKEGAVGPGPYGPAVTEEMKQAVETAKAAIISGELAVFEGPIRDQDGNLRVPEGEHLSMEDLLQMDWLLEGVEGSVSE
jgi:basic membrane protein A and related proteins